MNYKNSASLNNNTLHIEETPNNSDTDSQNKKPADEIDFDDSQAVLKKLQQMNWDFHDADTSFLTHDLHPYPAKFIPQIPANFISNLTLRGELILDPFGGSGTTAFEAIRLGRNAVSLDANPVSKVIGRAKTTSLIPEEFQSLRYLISTVRKKYSELFDGYLTHDQLFQQYGNLIPEIPNIEKWFNPMALSELALLKHLIESICLNQAKDVAFTSFIKIVMKVCNQESETRYASVSKEISTGQALKLYSTELTTMINKVTESMDFIQNANVDFRDADARTWETWGIEPESVSLIVTSPPYPNAYDYHLYHRFRIFWLGRNPGELRNVEIGSHLRHQSKKDGFENYIAEMTLVLTNMHTALQSGRYAALVVGNGVYNGMEYETGKELLKLSTNLGFEPLGIIERNLPNNKRSVTSPGRRLQKEDIVLLRKPKKNYSVLLSSPNYSLFEYEKELQRKEVTALIGNHETFDEDDTGTLRVSCPSEKITELRKLSFVHSFQIENLSPQLTWQNRLEETGEDNQRTRKDPKYVTHGLHTYKGKFYPQLAKSLINISKIKKGSIILDPFMGSGTVLLESYLNGYHGVGMDMNPLAVHIAKAKIGILKENFNVVEQVTRDVLQKINETPIVNNNWTEFPTICHDEIKNWFAEPVIIKINHLLKIIRSPRSSNIIRFLEVCLSDIIRDISHQDPKDLRIRKRQVFLEDAPVFEMFRNKVIEQLERVRSYWSVTPFSPTSVYSADITLGDNRQIQSFYNLGLRDNSVDLVVTSPPYFTALPYIDTDRLSLLTILGIPRSENSIIERAITGSREITKRQKSTLESSINELRLPTTVLDIVNKIQTALLEDETAGFRKQNTPALLIRYFNDMNLIMNNLFRVLKKGSLAWIVLGNNKTSVGDEEFLIDSVSLLKDIAIANGFQLYDEINISVTRENMKHIRNSITENGVIGFIKE